MRNLTSEEINSAIQMASNDAIDLYFLLDGKDQDLVHSIPQPEDIPRADTNYINRQMRYVILGLVPLTEAIDDVLDTIEGDENALIAYIQSVFYAGTKQVRLDILRNKVNKESDKTDLSLITDDLTDGREGKETIKSVTGINSGEILKNNFTKESILDEIENPETSVKKLEFALPKSKPSTLDILKNILLNEEPEIQIIDPIKGVNVIGSTEEPKILDPFKLKKEEPVTPKPAPVIPQPQTQASAIKDNLDKKLTEVTGTEVKETFKMKDMYRESIDLK